MKFVTQCDSNRYHFLRWQVESIKKHAPKDEYVIYDHGLEPWQIEEINSCYPKAVIKNFEEIGEEYHRLIDPIPDIQMRADGGRARITRSSTKKLWCLKNELTDYNEIVYLDADAFLNHPMGAVFEWDFDICLTLKRQQQIPINVLEDPKHWHFRLINAGVQFFKGEPNKLHAYFDLLKEYILEMPNLSDQGNINRILAKTGGITFTESDKSYSLSIRGETIKISLIRCAIYNRLVRLGEDLHNFIIAHLKGQGGKIKSYKEIKNAFKK